MLRNWKQIGSLLDVSQFLFLSFALAVIDSLSNEGALSAIPLFTNICPQ